MAEYEKIEKIGRVDEKRKVDGDAYIDEADRIPPNKEHFDALITAENSKSQRVTEVNEQQMKKVTLMEEIREVGGRVDWMRKKSPDELAVQTRDVIAQVDEIKKKLKTADLKIDPSVQSLMESKLSHIDEKLRVAIEKTGGQYTTFETREARASLRNPIEKFLGYLENGESQLQHIAKEVSSMGANNQSITPANMLLIQIKVGFVQQELEFFTSLLNKSLESTKTLMNVQV
ncbi:MAG: hypothetical protein WC222_00190 [Parachlamydiales bacterium]|jgi:ribosomal protein L31E